MMSTSGEQSPAWHWEGRPSVIIPTIVHFNLETRIGALPAAFNARLSREGVAAHFLQTDSTVALFTSHLSRGDAYQLPQVNRVVVQQWQQAALSQITQVMASVWCSAISKIISWQGAHLSRQEVDLRDSSGIFVESCKLHTRNPIAAGIQLRKAAKTESFGDCSTSLQLADMPWRKQILKTIEEIWCG